MRDTSTSFLPGLLLLEELQRLKEHLELRLDVDDRARALVFKWEVSATGLSRNEQAELLAHLHLAAIPCPRLARHIMRWAKI
jgi:hypothetical protein